MRGRKIQAKHRVATLSAVVFVFSFAELVSAHEFSLLKMDHRAIVSRGDLIYDSPAKTSIEGQPIGNGKMGTLVWTTPSAIHFQINRNDVFAANSDHTGTRFGPTDYCGACAKITLDVGGKPFATSKSRLSLYDAEATIAGEAVSVRCFVNATSDVLALEIDDRRNQPQLVRLNVSMWRAPKVVHGSHVARYKFVASNGTARVVQRFRDKDYHSASAVASCFAGEGTQVEVAGERGRTILAPAKRGRRTVLISSAAPWKPGADVGETAVALLDGVGKDTYTDLRREHTKWWHDFWPRTFVHLTSDDGAGEFMHRMRYLHLYYMASSSRGALPPKWNGSLFVTEGDDRKWGSQFWVWTTEMLYFPLLAADAIDLTESYFDMYVRQLPSCEIAARQRWNSQRAFFPETTAFDGPTVLPDDVAAEFQDVMLGRKKHTEMSEHARALCQFDSHLRATTNPREGRYSWISHVASSGSELALQAWWRYRYTGDIAWLRSHAYPLLRGTVEFYRHLVKKGEDGRYHLSGTNAHEDFWGVRDSIMDLAAIRGTVPLAIRAAEILDVDTQLRSHWRELLKSLTPYPMDSDPQSKALTGGVLADNVWTAGHLVDIDGQHNPEDVWLNPVFPFEDWTLETRQATLDKIVHKILDLAPRHASVLNGNKLNTAIRTPIAVARAGRGHELPNVLANYYKAFSPLPNGMSMFEGPNAQSIEHLGLIVTTLQDGLLQNISPRPGEPEIINVFPAWPKKWGAAFRLLARGGFLVTSVVQSGEVEFVEIESRRGEECRLRNPWERSCLLTGVGGRARKLSGDILRFDTQPGEYYRVFPEGKPMPMPRQLSIAPTTNPGLRARRQKPDNDTAGLANN